MTPIPPTATLIATDTELVPLPPTPLGGSGWLAYVSDASGIPNIDLFLIEEGKIELPDQSEAENNPSWNPSRDHYTQLAYDSSNSDARAVYVREANGLDQRRLTDYSQFSDPTWSPDGQRIAFVSVQDGNADIYVINANGEGEPVRLTTDPDWDADPSWSPDSRLIAFASNRDEGAGFQIYVMNADDGSAQTRLLNNRPIGTWNSFPNWSHDGSRIVFQSRDNSDFPFQIYVMDASGTGNPVQLTSEGNNELAAWSPDDHWIAFRSNRDGNNEIYMMLADGSKQTNLTNDPGNDSHPAWLPYPVEWPGCWLGCGSATLNDI